MLDVVRTAKERMPARCPVCDVVNPSTRVEGIGPNSVVCATCGNPVTPFQFVHGYTAVFDEERQVGITVPEDVDEMTVNSDRN